MKFKAVLSLSGATFAFLLLPACGGSSAPNSVPTFTSASSVDMVENNELVGYVATVTDADNDKITFRITGGG